MMREFKINYMLNVKKILLLSMISMNIYADNINTLKGESACFRLDSPVKTNQPVFIKLIMASPLEQRIYMTLEYQF